MSFRAITSVPDNVHTVPLATGAIPSQRLRSIDVFRGATIAAMVLVNAQFSPVDAFPQFVHADWNGWTFADSIFPCFLFMVGLSMTLSTADRVARGEDRGQVLAHAARRAMLLFGCGVFIDALRLPMHEFPYVGFQHHLQLTGVLQKIAVCYLAAFLTLLWGEWRSVMAGIVGLNLVYLGLIYLYPVPGCGPGVLTPQCNFPGYVDRTLIGSFLSIDPRQDADGLGAIFPAISTVLFGTLAGRVIRQVPQTDRRARMLLSGGIALLLLGLILDALVVPINKVIWTTSYAVFFAGFAAVCLATWAWLVDVRQLGSWFRPIEILGRNAVAAYLISRPITNFAKVHVHGKALHDVLATSFDPARASMACALVVLVLVYAVIWSMHRIGWYLKF